LCAVPMRAHADIIGALKLFRGNDQPFSDADLEIAWAMAQVATIALIQERAIRERSLLAEQLQAALRSRVVIEQAKGMLAEHLSTTVDEAFQLLNKYARDHNRRLTEVARDVVDRTIPHDVLARRPGTSKSPGQPARIPAPGRRRHIREPIVQHLPVTLRSYVATQFGEVVRGIAACAAGPARSHPSSEPGVIPGAPRRPTAGSSQGGARPRRPAGSRGHVQGPLRSVSGRLAWKDQREYFLVNL